MLYRYKAGVLGQIRISIGLYESYLMLESPLSFYMTAKWLLWDEYSSYILLIASLLISGMYSAFTHSLMERSPSWEAANCVATQELPSILWNLKVHHYIHKSPPLVPIMSQFEPVHTIPSIFFSLGCLSKESVQIQGFLWSFLTSLIFMVRSC
jgi:hypothetical protein